ncbi:Transcription factor jumonji [Thalassoporum mexicanum PCC 7367]|uniref:cupin-like domain-containing protein n=1 Tax=Thalassoporum mexicanum TaxID=3457544 RepID=UPI00029FA607|nr:cupin-like domain-containing protein [Pseudanabaena sp. PCC 7367]AFY69726.1 Transcription factor jumonji [Pseudanabaena sp. PCC 7367]
MFNHQSNRFNPIGYTPFTIDYQPLTDDWRRWIAENKLLGNSDESILAAAAKHNLNPIEVRQEIATLANHPYFQAGQYCAQMLGKLQSHLGIYAKLAQLSPQPQQIDCRDRLSTQEFLENYYATNTPVILTKMMDDWPAMQLWTIDYLKTTYGQVEVEVQTNRQTDRDYEINVDEHRQTVLFAEYIDRVCGQGTSNDYYMTAINNNLEKTKLRKLLADIEIFPDFLDPGDGDGKVYFWLGPAGTITPLHHDPGNLIMAQVMGRKLWRLIPPYQTQWLYNYQEYYSEVDCENPDYDRYPLYRNVEPIEVILEPGEAIFVPVGWWHHVRAIDITISVSFTNFRFDNEFNWQFPFLPRR